MTEELLKRLDQIRGEDHERGCEGRCCGCSCGFLSKQDVLFEEAAALIRQLKAEVEEARRRRDAWRTKAEGYDAVRLALREKVGAPWPPHLSRALWAGIAADEKKRADDAEAEVRQLKADNERMREDRKTLVNWLNSVADAPMDDICADGGVTVSMVVQQEAREFAARLDRAAQSLNQTERGEG